ncbi:MAG: TIGR04222 domain-containing membrane protein [Bernardetiaceae bacterium]|nr:TIGR04222 domain-containing membrane protein [Bernardetiaceae bacterium]
MYCFIANLSESMLALLIHTGVLAMIFVIFQILYSYVRSRKADDSDFEQITDIDYYEMAFLRDGAVAVYTLAIFELHRKGFIQKENNNFWRKMQSTPFMLEMPLIERYILKKMPPHSETFTDKWLFKKIANELKKVCNDMQKKLEQKELLADDKDFQNHKKIQRFMSSIALLLLLERIIAVFFQTANIGYQELLIMSLLTVLLAVYIMYFVRLPKRTVRGDIYFKNIQAIYTPQKETLQKQIIQGEQWLTWYDLDYALLFGIYGREMLQGSPMITTYPIITT